MRVLVNIIIRINLSSKFCPSNLGILKVKSVVVRVDKCCKYLEVIFVYGSFYFVSELVIFVLNNKTWIDLTLQFQINEKFETTFNKMKLSRQNKTLNIKFLDGSGLF